MQSQQSLILIKNQGFFSADLSYKNGLDDLHHLLARLNFFQNIGTGVAVRLQEIISCNDKQNCRIIGNILTESNASSNFSSGCPDAQLVSSAQENASSPSSFWSLLD